MATTRKRTTEGGVPDGLILGIIGFLLGITVLVWTATGIAGLLAHGRWPADVHFTRTPVAMRHLMSQPHDVAGAWSQSPPAALPGAGLFWGIFIGQLMVLFVVTVFVIGALARYRVVRAARREAAQAVAAGEALPGPRPAEATTASPTPADEAAHGREAPVAVEDSWPGAVEELRAPAPGVPARLAPSARGASDAPGAPGASEVSDASDEKAGGWPASAAGGTDPLADGELTRSYALFASPRGDKGKRVIQPVILNAAGPAVVTTADPDTYHQTVGTRSKLGPVLVYDPAHRLDVPGRLRWAPHSGCEHPAAAAARARALLAPLRPTAAADSAMFESAGTLLRCWLHAAAVDGLPFRQVHRWAGGGGGGEAVRILRTARAAASGWSGELEATLHAHPDRRDAAQALIHRALESLNSVHIRDACNPGRTGGLELESFLSERGTLYVVGEAIEDPRARPGAMPLLTALVSSVVEHGRRVAEGSSSGRLDPPMTLVLDDIAALAPLPELPELLAAGAAVGLPALAVFRSPEQARDRWRVPLWGKADTRLRLGDTAGSIVDEVPDSVQLT